MMVDLDPNKQPEASWETTYDPEISWKNGVFEAVNSMRDAQDSVDHYRMHLRHYQEEVANLKSKATHYETMYALAKDESDKLRLQNAEMKESLRQLRNSAERYYGNSISFQPTTEDIQERQARDELDPLVDNRFYADAVSNPNYDGPHKKYSSGDGLWAIACGRGAVAGAETGVRVTVWDGDVPTTDTVVHRGVWLSSAGRGELAKVQIISVKDRHNEP